MLPVGIGVFTTALLRAEFGQVWAEYMCHDVKPQLWRNQKVKEAFRGRTVIRMT